MATAAALPPAEPGDVIPLDPHEVDLGERLRPIDTAWATAIGQSMKRDGQIHAVDVRPRPDGRWLLIGAGGHRVTGARLAGIPIECRIVQFSDDVGRRREAAENLFRRANNPVERAEAIAELVRLHREQAGIEEAQHRAQSATTRLKEEAEGTCATIAQVYGWADEIAAEIGFSKRTIQYDLFLYRGLQPSVVQRLREHKHAILKNASQLRVLAKLGPDQQRKAVAHMLAHSTGLADAVALIANRPKPSAEDKRLSAFIGTFQRMSLSERRGALTQLAELIPAPFKLVTATGEEK